MSIEVKVPQLPESVADATLVAWHKKAGDTVRREENLVDLETDKVVLEVPAPADGVIKQIVAADGAVVTSGQVLGDPRARRRRRDGCGARGRGPGGETAPTAAPLKAVGAARGNARAPHARPRARCGRNALVGIGQQDGSCRAQARRRT